MSVLTALIFVALDDIGTSNAKRQIRSLAAQHSHKIGPRRRKRHRQHKSKRNESTAASTVELPWELLRLPPFFSPNGQRMSVSQDVIQRWLVQMPGRLIDSIGNPATTDPFETYPVPPEPWYQEVIDMWQVVIARIFARPDVEIQEQRKALIWVQQLAWSDPSYFYMNMLSAANELVQVGHLHPRSTLWLKGKLVAAINAGLETFSETLNPGLILAVHRIAFHEIVLEDRREGESVHRPALIKMIAMAGGLDALGLPLWIKNHVMWQTRLMTEVTGVDAEAASLPDPFWSDSANTHDIEDDVQRLDLYLHRRVKRLEDR